MSSEPADGRPPARYGLPPVRRYRSSAMGPGAQHARSCRATCARVRTAATATTSCSAATATSSRSSTICRSTCSRAARDGVRGLASITPSVTYSLNSQREERVNQGGNGNPTATIGHEPERTTVQRRAGQFVAKQLSPRQSLSYRRRCVLRTPDVRSLQRQPRDGAISPRRPRVPSGATYHTGRRLRADRLTTAVPDRLRLVGALRCGRGQLRSQAPPTLPSSTGNRSGRTIRFTSSDVTFRVARSSLTPTEPWTSLLAISEVSGRRT